MADQSNYTMELQRKIDRSDPYLVEVLVDKTDDELMSYLERLHRELQIIPMSNPEWRSRHLAIIDSVQAFYEMRMLNTGGGKGGLVIA